MSKALFGVLIFASIFLIIVLTVVFRFLYRLYKKIRNAKRTMEEAMHAGRDFTGRRAQQYHFDKNGKKQHSSKNTAAQDEPRHIKTESGEVIIDHRQQDRKIFSADDGEYVDFSED